MIEVIVRYVIPGGILLVTFGIFIGSRIQRADDANQSLKPVDQQPNWWRKDVFAAELRAKNKQ